MAGFVTDNWEFLYGICGVGVAIIFATVIITRKLADNASGYRTCGEQKGQQPFKKTPKPVSCPREFTTAELAEFDGTSDVLPGSPIYVSVRGKVFDMTSHPTGRTLYGPDGPYNVFAGRDATVGLAKMSTDPSLTNLPPSSWPSLSLSEKETLASWMDKFEDKYDVVGHVTPHQDTTTTTTPTTSTTTSTTTPTEGEMADRKES